MQHNFIIALHYYILFHCEMNCCIVWHHRPSLQYPCSTYSIQAKYSFPFIHSSLRVELHAPISLNLNNRLGLAELSHLSSTILSYLLNFSPFAGVSLRVSVNYSWIFLSFNQFHAFCNQTYLLSSCAHLLHGQPLGVGVSPSIEDKIIKQ